MLANIRPSGAFLMEDFYYAGGPQGAADASPTSSTSRLARSAAGRSGPGSGGAAVGNDEVIRPRDNPVYGEGALAVLTGNTAPDGCVIKPPAAEKHLLVHTGPAVVFADYNDMAARIDDRPCRRRRTRC
ncbi:MAG: dihydroxy-acid dehydratase [Dongiaceae bacterium]